MQRLRGMRRPAVTMLILAGVAALALTPRPRAGELYLLEDGGRLLRLEPSGS